jgi:hypothetical protein
MKSLIFVVLCLLCVQPAHAQFDPRYDFPTSWKRIDALTSLHPKNREELIDWFNIMMATKGLGPYWEIVDVKFEFSDAHPDEIDLAQVMLRSYDGTLWDWSGILSMQMRTSFRQE